LDIDCEGDEIYPLRVLFSKMNEKQECSEGLDGDRMEEEEKGFGFLTANLSLEI
jgi:hypothetical protein